MPWSERWLTSGPRTLVSANARSGESQIEILDSLVNFGGVLVANRDAIHARIVEREAHGSFAVLARGKRAFTDQLHTNDAEALGLHLPGVLHHFADIAWAAGVVVPGVHLGAFVIHADHGDLQPIVAGSAAERGQTVHGGPTADDDFLRLGFLNSILPAFGAVRPSAYVLVMHQHHVEVIGVRLFAQFVNFGGRIDTIARRDLRHQAIRVARHTLECDAEHFVHFAIGLGGLEETDTVVVGVAHEPGELVLPEVALHLAAVGSGAEGEASHFDVRFPERHPVGRGPARPTKGQTSGSRKHARGESGLEEITSRTSRHVLPPTGHILSLAAKFRPWTLMIISPSGGVVHD